MAIDPIAAGQRALLDNLETATSSGSNSTATPNVRFESYLTGNSAAGQQVTAATAAEILRLKMLDSALTLGDNNKGTTRSSDVQGLLERFLAQMPNQPQGENKAGEAAAGAGQAGAAAGTASAAAAVPVSDGNDGDQSIDALVQKASRRYGVDAGLIKAVIKAESNFNPRAVSSAGAQGLMQLMPSTARGLGVTDSFDPEQNVMAGTRFLKDMLQRYGGNVEEALAAYNWGPGHVDKHGTDNLPRETRAYLAKVKGYYSQYVA
jgi:soluble lytic murein transglycosylase-like protein